MVWHILKKDWTLLWPVVSAVAVLQSLLAFGRFTRVGAGVLFSPLPTTPAGLLELLAAATLIILLVHQDPVPGVRQDWLVRPVARRDLFLAKLLFVVVFVHGPWFATDLLQGLANGFSWGQSATAATTCAVSVLLTLSLPALAFATLTATMTETLVAALGVLALVIASMFVPGLVGATKPAASTGFAWVPSLVRDGVLFAAAAAVLILQYRSRRTPAARALCAAAVVVGLGASFLPWRTTIRLEQVLDASPRDDGGIAVAFAPGAGRFRPAPGQALDDVPEKPGMGAEDVAAENRRRRAEGARTVFLPLRVSGLNPDTRLLADRSEVAVVTRDGRVLHRGTGNDLELRAVGADATVHQGIRVPGALFGGVKAEPVDVELEYWFTVFRISSTYALPARGGNQRMPGVGWCATKVDDAGTRIVFLCLQPGERPSCLDVALEHVPTGLRNPAVSLCAPDYTPYPGHTFPDALSRFGGRLPFYDPSGFVQYPVGGPQLSDARVLVTAFQPMQHLVRRVVIPAVRLEDWEPQRPTSASGSQ